VCLIGRLGHAPGLLGHLGHPRRLRGKQASRADSLVSTHSAGIKACRPMCILEREREHIRSIWSRITCLDSLLAAAQSLARRAPGDSQSLRRLTVVIGNKKHK
jgi:hypothetical protein